MHTTLSKLLQSDACTTGYNKLVCHLNEQDYFRSPRYLSCVVDGHTPISLKTILDSNGVEDAA